MKLQEIVIKLYFSKLTTKIIDSFLDVFAVLQDLAMPLDHYWDVKYKCFCDYTRLIQSSQAKENPESGI